MFHPRGMGPRPLRPGMRPFGPRGPPFDPREPDAFFRPPFDDIRPHVRPPFGPMGPPSIIPPESAAPWRNQELPPGSWSAESENHSQRDNARDKKGGNKHPSNQIVERENRNRGRKSRWTNVSPSADDSEEAKEQETTSANIEETEEQPAKEENVIVQEEEENEEIETKGIIPNEQSGEDLGATVEAKEEVVEPNKEEEEDCRDS